MLTGARPAELNDAFPCRLSVCRALLSVCCVLLNVCRDLLNEYQLNAHRYALYLFFFE
jgi:hypothetical protein